MEHLCELYPNESILFLKRAIVTTIISGLILTTPIIICIYNVDYNDTLQFWSYLRIFLFLIQIPLRFHVWNKLNKCYDNSKQLINILKSRSFVYTQIASFIVLIWVLITMINTFILNKYYNYNNNNNYFYFCFNGHLSLCLYRWSQISIIIFLTHIIFIFCWLRNLMITTRNNITYNSFNSFYSLLNNECNECSICNDNDNKQLLFIKLNQCLHQFHKKCIDEWFKKKKQCPLCLKYLEKKDDKKEKTEKNEIINIQNHIIYLRNRRLSSSASKEAIDVLLNSPNCNNNNSLFYFMPN